LNLIGQRIDKYDVLEEVGHGGMAVVYRGLDRDLDREVAVKVLHAHLADRGESRKRLHREAITVARLRHPNIVEIYDYANPDAGKSYIVTEFIHGQTLRSWLEDRWKPRPLLAALVIYRLCRALDHAHSLGIVHRDIKPENVMIRSDGCIKLMDFGIAQLVDHQKLTMTGQLLGSPAYMAPELINGKPVDARTDIFALGILLYQLSTGQLPFNGRNPHEVLSRIANTEFAPASSINPRVDERIEAIINKALAREPGDRYQSATAFAADLAAYAEEHGFAPDEDDLERFFRDSSHELAKLDARLCELFLDRGRTAAQAGQSARALRFLSRVLDIEPDHEQALLLVTQVQTRGHRMRQLALGAAVVGMGGVIAAGIFMMQRNESHTESKSVEAQAGLSAQVTKKNAALAPQIGKSQQNPKTPSKNAGPTEGNGDASPLDVSLASQDIARIKNPEQAKPSDDAQAKADLSDNPSRRPENSDRDATTSEKSPRKSDRAEESGGEEGAAVSCRVKVDGIPVPSRGHYALTQLGTSATYVLPPNQQTAIEVSVPPQGTVLRLQGARPGTIDGFEGSLQVHPANCSAPTPLVLRASVKPAKLKFVAKNFPIDSLVVRCTDGCGASGGSNRLARDFGSIELPPGTLEQAISLEFKVDGYRRLQRIYRVHPGSNEIDIELDVIEEPE
jgi:serine/threonine-protein kinase